MTETEGKRRADLIAELQAQKKPDLLSNRPPSPPSASRPVATTAQLARPLEGAQRFQYAVVNVGSFNSADRMSDVLATAGAAGWELVTIYDKASNWIGGWEKGFMLLKRAVPEGVNPGAWCLQIRG